MSPLLGLYRLQLRQQFGLGRLVVGGGMGVLAVGFGFLIAGNVSEFERTEATIGFLSVFGLGLMVPILCLVLASSTLGNLVEDETLVYLWIRPIPRWMLAVTAWAAAATVAVPASAIPLTLAAIIGSGGDGTAIGATVASMTLAAVAYTGIFTLVGLVLRRALIWGLVYVFIWELFVARVGQGAARLSINTYPASVLAKLTDLELPLAERSLTNGVMVPILVTVAAIALTSWRLDRGNVA
jgi:ABC-2 type transport system permease protein